MATVLVAGGAGFLGSHMCDRLISEGCRVICVDSLITGRRENVSHLLDDERFTFLTHDVAEPLQVEGQLTHVLHFASPASPNDYARYPIETMKAGAFGTYNLLELAREKRAVFLVASTSEVYGDPEIHPQTEEYWGHVNPVGLRSVYDEAKRYAEALTMAYHRKHRLTIRIARIFNTYGPRMRIGDGRALPTFITQALQAKPLSVYGNGMQTRSFCYVDDMIEGLYRFLVREGRETGPVNLGNPDEVCILDVAREVLRATNSGSRIEFHPLPLDDPRTRQPDIGKAKQLLGWGPRIDRQQGLLKTVDWFKQMLEIGP